MNDEYVIINKTELLNRIEELKNKRDSEHKRGHDKSALRYENTILESKQILSQSTPLIPEIEKAFDEGTKVPYDKSKPLNRWWVNIDRRKENYITNLKLDI